MKIVLVDVQTSMVEAWRRHLAQLECVEIVHGSIFEVPCDAVVSPANSFGFMDGGLDALYMDFFGPKIQRKVRQAICERHHGELLVGAAEIVETDHERIPYLIAAPTMRVPMILKESVNAYLATRAALLLIAHGLLATGPQAGKPIREAVRTVAFPGLGTGVGSIGFNTCALQMRQAISDTVLGQYQMPKSWAEASERHQLLYTDRPRRLQ